MPSEVSIYPTVDESARRQFEAAWRAGGVVVIEDHLPPSSDPRYLPTLEELIHIDLEMAWKNQSCEAHRPRVEDYLTRFPVLRDPDIVLRLVRQEYRVRNQYGDRPSSHEYVTRFPELQVSTADIETAVPPRAEIETPPSIPGYEIIERIGRGGMGVVYSARQMGLGRLVAIKLLRGSDEDVTRFRTEAEVVARLRHPNVVQVHEIGTSDGRPYLVLEYIRGGSLDRAIAGTPQQPAAAAMIVENLARAIHNAHLAGVLHRDLKPANVLLDTVSDESGITHHLGSLPLTSTIPKLTDFGLAKQLHADSRQTYTGAVLGTPSYMAPEQAAGRADVGPAADVYGLGAILYELLTGRPPFRAATAFDTIQQVLHDDPVSPARLQPTVPRDLETICLKCLHKVPSRRYTSAQDLADDLGRFRQGEPVRARPVGTRERVVKWVRRRPAAAGLLLATVVAVIALVGSGVAVYFNNQLRTARDLAELRRSDAEVQRYIAEHERQDADALRVLAESRRVEADTQRNEADTRRREAEASAAEAKQQRELARRYQYLAQVNLAYRTAEDRNVFQALEILDRYKSAGPGLSDLRGFEWYYVRRLTRNRHVLRGHNEDVNDVVISPDGRTIASAAWDNTVRIWDLRTGEHLFTLTNHDKTSSIKIGGIAFNPSGTRLAATHGTAVFIFDTTTWTVLKSFVAHRDFIGGVAFSPDGISLATGSSDGTVKVWDYASGQLLQALKCEQNEMVRRVAFSPDGTSLAWVSALVDPDRTREVGGAMTVWDLMGQRAITEHRWMGRGANDLAFHPQGSRVALANSNGDIQVYQLPSGDESLRYRAHERGAMAVRYSPDGLRLATAGYDLTVRIWNAGDGTESLALRGHTDRGTRIKARGEAGVNRVAFSPDGVQLVSVGDDRNVMIWDVGPAPVPSPPDQPADSLNTRYSPDGNYVAVWVKPSVEIRDVATGHIRHLLTGTSDQALRMWFNDSGSRFLVEYGRPDRERVTVWDVDTGRDLLTVRPASTDKLHLSTDGNWLIASGKSVRVWNVATGQETVGTVGHDTRITLASVSPDGRWLATAAGDADLGGRDWGYADGDVKLWDMATGQLAGNLRGHTWVVRDLAWRPDSQELATTGQDGTIRLWKLATGEQRGRLTGHRLSILCLTYSPDGTRIASGGQDGTVRLWDVSTGEEVLTLKGQPDYVWKVEFDPVGHILTSWHGKSPTTSKRVVWDARPINR